MKEKVSLIFPWPHSIINKLSWNNFIFTHLTQREFKKLGAAYSLRDSQEVCEIIPKKHILSHEGVASERLTNKNISANQNSRCTNPNRCTEQSLLLSLCTSHQSPQRLVSYDQTATPVAAACVTGPYLTPEVQLGWNWNWRCPRAMCVSWEYRHIGSLYWPLHSGC